MKVEETVLKHLFFFQGNRRLYSRTQLIGEIFTGFEFLNYYFFSSKKCWIFVKRKKNWKLYLKKIHYLQNIERFISLKQITQIVVYVNFKKQKLICVKNFSHRKKGIFFTIYIFPFENKNKLILNSLNYTYELSKPKRSNVK